MNECSVFCSTKIDGGGEQSAAYIARLLGAQLVSLTGDDWHGHQAKKQIWYMNDQVYALADKNKKQAEFIRVLSSAEEIYIVLNFVLGGLHRCDWLGFYPINKILFLNTTKENEWKNHVARKPDGGYEFSGLYNIPTASLAPCVDIARYLDIKHVPGDKIRVGRHSRISLKYPPDPCRIYHNLIAGNGHGLEFRFMLAHKKIQAEFEKDERFKFYNWNEPPVAEFLAETDIFLYQISPTCKDQGPRVIVEAMAAGIPCVTENRDGMADRIVHGQTGFLCDSHDDLVDKTMLLAGDSALRQRMGQAAREYAMRNFSALNWVKELQSG